MTARGFCALAAVSRKIKPGLFSNTGKSRRSACGSRRPAATGIVRRSATGDMRSVLRVGEPSVEVAAPIGLGRRIFDQPDGLGGEGLDQHASRLGLGNAAGAQIEHRRLVEIADG